MRYFEKQLDSEHLTIFNQWKAENSEKIQEWIDNEAKTGNHLWGELGKTFGEERETTINPQVLRNALETALFEEQGGLCCYCGNTIERNRHTKTNMWIYQYRTIEHFEPKNKFKNKTFDIENLMLCCKGSQKLTYYTVGRIVNNIQVQSFEDVAILSDLPVSTIKTYHKNQEISARPLRNGDQIHVPNPLHCDDAKSKYDSKTADTTIINPTKDKERIEKLVFSSNGRIDYVNRETEPEEVIENTFKVLALNCDILVERRQKKWENTLINWGNIVEAMDSEDEIAKKNIMTNIINKLIEGKAKPNGEGVLEPFYFVEIAFLKSLFNARL